MPIFNRLTGALHAIVRRKRDDAELDEELASYVAAASEEKIAAGLSPEEARRIARAELGSPAAVKDSVRAVGWESLFESVWQDVRYALRTLRRSPGFATVAILTFALGIGTNIAIFTLADGMLFRPLPYREPGRLVMIQSYSAARGQAFNMVLRVDVEQLRSHHSGLEGIAAARTGSPLTRIGSDGAESITTSYGTPNLLELLGVGAHIGRPLRPGDEVMEPRAAMLTYDAWQRRFGEDTPVVGRTIPFDQMSVQIVGVLPRGFIYPLQGSLADGDLLFVRALDPAEAANPRSGVISPIARLKPGVSIAEAQSEVDVLVRRAAQQFPSTTPERALRVASLQYTLFELSRSLLWLLISAAGGVLIVACVNMASLLLARGTAREREIGIRTAIGASRMRVARQMLVECIVLGVLAGGVALVVAALTLDTFAAQIPAWQRRVPPVLDGRTVTVTLLMAIGASILFGVLPAFRLSGTNAAASIRETRKTGASGARFMKAGAPLLAVEVAVCLILLTGTGLTANSLIRRRTVDLGFSRKDAVLLRFVPPASRYPTPLAFDFHQRVLEEIRRLPDVTAAAIDFPQLGRTPAGSAVRDDMPAGSGVWSVTPQYFSTIGVHLLEGRDFSDADVRSDAPVAIVSASIARHLWPGQPAIGQILTTPGEPARTIIGLVADVRSEYGGAVRPSVYRPITRNRYRVMTIVARGSGDASTLGTAMRTVVQRLDPGIIVAPPRTVGETLKRGVEDSQFQTALFALFGVVGLLVSAVGIYGVMGHWVSSRTRELGVRLALGAEPMQLRTLVIRQVSVPLLVGMAGGLLGAFVLTKRLQSLLYEVTPHDPGTLGAVTFILLVVGIVAAYVPARRAARVDPIIALRAE